MTKTTALCLLIIVASFVLLAVLPEHLPWATP